MVEKHDTVCNNEDDVRLIEPCQTWLEKFEVFKNECPDLPSVYAPETEPGESMIDLLRSQERGERLPEGYVPASHYWLVRGQEIVGIANVRHRLNEFVSFRGGHIGYYIKASERRKGYATQLLAKSLPWCRKWGIQTLLITCDDSNVGSYKTIEANGGVLVSTDVDHEGALFRRYHIQL